MERGHIYVVPNYIVYRSKSTVHAKCPTQSLPVATNDHLDLTDNQDNAALLIDLQINIYQICLRPPT